MPSKIYTPQRRFELKAVGNLIKDKPANEKALIKAQELSKAKLPKKFSLNGFDIEIISLPIELNGNLNVSIRAWKNGKELFIDNPLIYQNPPIMVPDGTYHKVINPMTGVEEEKSNFVEDLEQALKEIIVDTVRITGK